MPRARSLVGGSLDWASSARPPGRRPAGRRPRVAPRRRGPRAPKSATSLDGLRRPALACSGSGDRRGADGPGSREGRDGDGVEHRAVEGREDGTCAAAIEAAPRRAETRMAPTVAARSRRCRRPDRRSMSSRPTRVGIMPAMVPGAPCQTPDPRRTGPLRDPRNLRPEGRRYTRPRWTSTSSGRSPPPPSAPPWTASWGRRSSGWVGGVATAPASTATPPAAGTRLRGRRTQLLPALHAVQDRVGWISQPALNYISRRLAVPPAEAYGVATFYALYATKPRPPIVAHVCDDIACRIAGAEGICDDLRRAVGPEGEAARDGADRLDALARASGCATWPRPRWSRRPARRRRGRASRPRMRPAIVARLESTAAARPQPTLRQADAASGDLRLLRPGRPASTRRRSTTTGRPAATRA